ncbi:hypothetical protein DPMN_051498 [Dreissena polymorpha]|uniref:Uncharacterized protein n=1 Tax=Dreissena polymorpha TaxID=45954 RepID=A0A9D4HND0_DREPO|nr:hypothetical protein DPMN_051498 [Dreissena polymorpha]
MKEIQKDKVRRDRELGMTLKNINIRRKTAPSRGGQVFRRNGTIFNLSQDINATNVLIKFHEDLATMLFRQTNVLAEFHKHVTPRVLTRKTAPNLDGNGFQHIAAIINLGPDIYRMLYRILQNYTASLVQKGIN